MVITEGKNALSKNANGRIMTLFRNDPLVIAHNTGISRDVENPEAFSALTARSSPRIAEVFPAATLLIEAISSNKTVISSSNAKMPEAIIFFNIPPKDIH